MNTTPAKLQCRFPYIDPPDRLWGLAEGHSDLSAYGATKAALRSFVRTCQSGYRV